MIDKIITVVTLGLITADFFVQRYINKLHKLAIEKLIDEKAALEKKIDALELAFKAQLEAPKKQQDSTLELINEWLNGPQQEDEE